MFRSNFPLADVQGFLAGYENSMNKDDYLKKMQLRRVRSHLELITLRMQLCQFWTMMDSDTMAALGGERKSHKQKLERSLKKLSSCCKIGMFWVETEWENLVLRCWKASRVPPEPRQTSIPSLTLVWRSSGVKWPWQGSEVLRGPAIIIS